MTNISRRKNSRVTFETSWFINCFGQAEGISVQTLRFKGDRMGRCVKSSRLSTLILVEG